MVNNQSPADDQEQQLFAIRNRALLYLRAMGIGALPGMELVAESIRRAGTRVRMDRVFDELFALLRERDLQPPALGSIARHAAYPPFNRRSMLARKLPAFSYRAAVRTTFAAFLNLLTLRNVLWKSR